VAECTVTADLVKGVDVDEELYAEEAPTLQSPAMLGLQGEAMTGPATRPWLLLRCRNTFLLKILPALGPTLLRPLPLITEVRKEREEVEAEGWGWEAEAAREAELREKFSAEDGCCGPPAREPTVNCEST
jgi:hypothetical protein